MNRRKFLKQSAFSVAGAGLWSSSATAQSASRSGQKPSRPNILVISTDQQFAGAMSCAGNPYLRTPNMDALFRHGLQFDRAYCSNPICVPSRASYMTGLMPHETGIRYNASSFDQPMRGQCFAKYFQEAGYDTGHVGKWHIPRPLEDREWSGFNYLAAMRNTKVDNAIPAAADAFLRKDRGDQPFLLFTSFVNPHDICQWARLASGQEETLPNGDIGDPPPPEKCPPLIANHLVPEREPSVIREHASQPGNAGTYPTQNWGGPEDGRWRQYLWAYYRLTEKVDGLIGQVLRTLRETGQEENTIIVFFSDHGDGIGAHRWNQKTLFYDEVSRVPFIVSWKGKTVEATREGRHLFNLGTDLAPTLLDFAGIERPADLRGISAKPIALGEAPERTRDFLVSENNLHPKYGVEGEHHGRMVRSRRYKYIRFNGGENPEQLFDLELDPGEMNSLVADPAHRDTLDQHRAMLDTYIEETNDYFPKKRA